MISLARLNRVLEVDLERGRAVVEPGVTNLDITKAVAAGGYYYAPDPSSQQVCTIGGNVAENSGGAHCLKYGFTVNHVLAADVVLADGTLVSSRATTRARTCSGCSSARRERSGIVVRVVVRLLRTPETVRTLLAGFQTTDAAGDAVSHTIAAGILPSAIEMMDALTDRGRRGGGGRRLSGGGRRRADRRARRARSPGGEDFGGGRGVCRQYGGFELRTADTPEDRRADLARP